MGNGHYVFSSQAPNCDPLQHHCSCQLCYSIFYLDVLFENSKKKSNLELLAKTTNQTTNASKLNDRPSLYVDAKYPPVPPPPRYEYHFLTLMYCPDSSSNCQPCKQSVYGGVRGRVAASSYFHRCKINYGEQLHYSDQNPLFP